MIQDIDYAEDRKTIIAEATVGDVTTTYIGSCTRKAYEAELEKSNTPEDEAIWRIKKIVADASSSPTITTISYPTIAEEGANFPSFSDKFAWSNRVSETYK